MYFAILEMIIPKNKVVFCKERDAICFVKGTKSKTDNIFYLFT